jgi:SAM-dependent methyltransferase
MQVTTDKKIGSVWEVAEVCGLCGSTRFEELFDLHHKRYVTCAECRVTRLYDRVAAHKLDLIYGDYFGPLDAAFSEQEQKAYLTNPTFAFRRKRLEAFVSERAIYEIGCGDGSFLAYLQNHHWQVQGCEFSQKTADLIKARHDLEVAVGDFTRLPVEPGTIDVIGSYHVFEHLYEPLDWLRAVRRALKPGGVLHLQLPNFRCWERYLTTNCWNLLGFPQHVYFYSPAALSRVLDNEGFRPMSIKTYDPFHSPGTTLASARHFLKRLLTGKLPWSEALERLSSIDNSDGRCTTAGEKKLATQLFDLVGQPVAVVLARAQSLFGFGNIIDVIAKVNSSPQRS